MLTIPLLRVHGNNCGIPLNWIAKLKCIASLHFDCSFFLYLSLHSTALRSLAVSVASSSCGGSSCLGLGPSGPKCHCLCRGLRSQTPWQSILCIAMHSKAYQGIETNSKAYEAFTASDTHTHTYDTPTSTTSGSNCWKVGKGEEGDWEKAADWFSTLFICFLGCAGFVSCVFVFIGFSVFEA